MRERKIQTQIPKEPAAKLYSHEQFFDMLYDRILNWLVKGRAGEIVAEFGPQEVPGWTYYRPLPGTRINLPATIEKAALLRNSDTEFGLALSTRIRPRHAALPTLGLQFGSRSRQEIELAADRVSTHYLSRVVNRRSSSAVGEFHLDNPTRTLLIRYWIDNSFVGRYPQEKFFNEAGLQTCLGIAEKILSQTS